MNGTRDLRTTLVQPLRPASLRVSYALAAVAFLAAWLLLEPRTRTNGTFRVDEAHKVSESVALRLVLEQRWSDVRWFREMVDRTNPQVGKYFFGAAVLLSGQELPSAPSLSRLARGGLMAPYVAHADAAPYLPLLQACRRASLFASALTAALLAFLAARLQGSVAALLAAGWFIQHWMTVQFGTSAIFDALLACLVFGTGALLLAFVAAPRRALLMAPLIALVCAAAFQTRLNAGVALAGALAVFTIVAIRERSRRVAGAAAVMLLIFVAGSVALNPYYWAVAPDDAAVPAGVREQRSFVPRVVSRFAAQVNELGTVLYAVNAEGVRLPLWAAASDERMPVRWDTVARLRFAWIAIADGAAGVLMSLAALSGLAIALARRDRTATIAVWALIVAGVTLLWLPVPWARYLSPVLPIVALYGGIGCAALLLRAAEAVRRIGIEPTPPAVTS